MSLGSRAINRLRDLYVHVCDRTRRLNAEREAYPRSMHHQAAGALIEQLEPRLMLSVSPTIAQSIDDWAIADTTQPQATTVNLFDVFDDDDSETIFRFDSNLGNFDVAMYEEDCPLTTANFRAYAEADAWDDTIIHRSVSNFIVQGGGFSYDNSSSDFNEWVSGVATFDPVANEFMHSNTVGTIAMAKIGDDPNSATSQWFFNLGDNSANLDYQNGGFTAFGEVLGDGMDIVNQMAGLTTYLPCVIENSMVTNVIHGALTDVPLDNMESILSGYVNFGTPEAPSFWNVADGGALTDAQFVQMNDIFEVQDMTFEVVDNTNPALVTPTIDAVTGQLTLDYTAGETGGSEITVRATDVDGNTTDETFAVNAADISIFAYTIDNGEVTITGLGSGEEEEDDFADPELGSSYAGHLILPSTIEGLPVTGIGGFAFYDCVGLTGVTIPDSVTTIGDRAFGCCRSMTNMVVAPDNANFSSVDGVLFNKDQTTLIQYPSGKTGPYTIPDSVTSIGNHAFAYCSGLTSVTIPGSVTSIGDSAFAYCSGLTSVTIPDSVTSIGDSAFYRCYALTSATIGNGVTSIGSAAFRECSVLTSATIGNKVASIGDHAFAYCTVLSNVAIPDSVTFIGEAAFAYCSGLTSVMIGNGLTSIEPFTYYMCAGLTSVTIGSGVTSIGSDAFTRSLGITSFVVDANSASFSSVDGVLFNKDQTTLRQCPAAKTGSYAIPDSVTTIGHQAFAYCVGLTSVTIPDSVTTIEEQAFYCCEGLTSLTIPDSVTSIGIESFSHGVSMTSLTLSNSLTTIPSFAFGQCTALTSLTIPDSVTTIEDRAFYSCRGLTSVTIPDSVTSIEWAAFKQCIGLTSIIIPDSVTIIDRSVFEECEGLTSVTIGNSVATIGNETFRDCIGLTSVTIPGSVTTIGHGAFRDCRGLTSVTMSNGTTSLGVSVFRGCFDLADITIPESVTTIEESAFASCRGLTSVTIPDSVTTIGNEAFINCSGLTSAIFEGDAPALNSSGLNSMPAIRDDAVYSSGELTNTSLAVETQSSFGDDVFYGAATGFTVYFYEGAAGFTSPTWNGYASEMLAAPVDISMLTYTIADGEVTITDCDQFITTEVIIPDTIEGLPVTTIGAQAFYMCRSLPSVTIGANVTDIGDAAFRYCHALTSVTIPDSVATIGSRAFTPCYTLTNLIASPGSANFSSVDGVLFNKDQTTLVQCPAGKTGAYTIPNTVTTIGDSAFDDCNDLTSVTIPDDVTSIGFSAFADCGDLASVTIGNGVTSIGIYAFRSCDALVDIVVSPDNATFSSVDGVLFNKDQTTLVQYPAGKTGAYTIPDTVTAIGDNAFAHCDALTSVTIPDSVTSIGNSAFSYCDGLASATFEGDAPSSFGGAVFQHAAEGFTVYYHEGAAGFATPTWNDYASEMIPAPDISMLTYTIANGEVTISDCDTAYVGEVIIPDTIEDLPVTTIGDSAFRDCSSLTSVTIPDGVTSIGKHTFFSCDGLTNVTIGNKVTAIGGWAFGHCDGLTNVTIGSSVTSIGDYAFYGCDGLTSVTIPDGVTSIGDYAFAYCDGLTSITIPGSVTFMGRYAFAYSDDLASVTILDGVTSIGDYAFYDCDGLMSVTIPSSVTSIGERAFSDCRGLTSVTILDGVTTIGDYAFAYCSALTSLTIGDSVTTIGNYAFAGCGRLANVTIGNSVASIGDHAFYNCDDLTSVTIPNSVTSIGNFTFYNCVGLTNVTIGSNVISIGERAFYLCEGLTSVIIPDSVTTIGEYTFESCDGLTSIMIGAGVTSIGWGHFGYPQNLTSVTVDQSNASFSSMDGVLFNKDQTVLIGYPAGKGGPYTIPNSVTSIGDLAFRRCHSLTNITIPGSVTSIGDMAFWESEGLTSVTIPDSVATIGDYAFYDCDALTSVTIGNSVTSIGMWAFAHSAALTSVTMGDSVTTIGDSAFYDCDGLTSITIPDSVRTIGDSAFSSCAGLTNVTIPDSVRTIGDSAFSSCAGLTNVTIGDSVTSIGDSAFYNCDGLTSVTIGNGMTSIGDSAFRNCVALTSVTIPDSVTSIGEHAFAGCTALMSIAVSPNNANYSSADGVLFNKDQTTLVAYPAVKTGAYAIPNSVTTIGSYAFYNCDGLTSVTIPDSVTSIGDFAFYWCDGLTSVTMGNSVTSIGDFAFKGNRALTSVTISNSVTTIGNFAFRGNRALTSVTMGNSVTSIGDYAFEYCDALTSVTIPDSVTFIGDYAFANCDGLMSATFNGHAPTMGQYLLSEVFGNAPSGFTVYFYEGAAGFTTPTWQGYPTSQIDDDTLPTIHAIAAYPDPDIAGQTIVVWNATDNRAVVRMDYVCGALSGTATGNSVSLAIPEGNFTFSLTAYDAAGNSVSDSYSGTVAATAEVVQQAVDVDMGDGEESVGIVIDEDADGTPDVLIDPTTAEEFEIVHLTPTGITTTPSPVDPDAAEVVVDVDKTDGWIFVNIADPFNGSRELLTITTSDGRVINPDNWWLDDAGNICMLDDPAVTYELNFQNPATIEGSHLFYNNSSFDGNNTAANAADDAAIATDKSALLPGETATAANYSNYAKGINGIMIDVADLAGAPSASDFTFTAGNTADPSGWAAAPAPTSITVRTGEGANGSDRVTITWDDNAIENQWLQVTVLSDANGGSLGLEADDVFYFGNAVGDDGQSDTATVDLSDVMGAMNNPHGSGDRAGITDAYDYDRNGLVDLTDVMAAMNNGTSSGTRLQLISALLAPEPMSMTMGMPAVQSISEAVTVPAAVPAGVDATESVIPEPSAWMLEPARSVLLDSTWESSTESPVPASLTAVLDGGVQMSPLQPMASVELTAPIMEPLVVDSSVLPGIGTLLPDPQSLSLDNNPTDDLRTGIRIDPNVVL